MKKTKGYTLIEILLVLAIIGILVALSSVAFLSARKTARDAKRKTDLEQIRGALETYKTDKNFYPGSLSTPPQSGSGPVSVLSVFLTGGSSSYISSIPSDPISTLQYYYVPLSNGYALCAYLENGSSTAVPNCASGECGSLDAATVNCNYEVKNP